MYILILQTNIISSCFELESFSIEEKHCKYKNGTCTRIWLSEIPNENAFRALRHRIESVKVPTYLNTELQTSKHIKAVHI